MTKWWLLASPVPLAVSIVQAQTLPPPPSSALPVTPVSRAAPKMVAPALPSGYCLAASAAFLESETKAFDELKKCTRGDTIVIPAKSASAVARLCDFSKSIVTTQDHVVCVIFLPERVSK
jgi:hypothetical protein